MQHHRSAPYPPPDVQPTPSTPLARPLSRQSDFLIIGLFALRLTKRLIEGLEHYSGCDADIAWLANFLAPYHDNFALAKISGARKEDYLRTYPNIISNMKRQPRYPVRFMQMSPARGDCCGDRRRRGELTDAERLEMIDFSDAAGEWGSVVPLPASEVERMVALADQRRIADLEETHNNLNVNDRRRSVGP